VTIVVGYVPTKEGRAALRRAAQECQVRRSALIVINSNRGGGHYDADEASRFEGELEQVKAQLDGAGLVLEVVAGGEGPVAGAGHDADPLFRIGGEGEMKCGEFGGTDAGAETGRHGDDGFTHDTGPSGQAVSPIVAMSITKR